MKRIIFFLGIIVSVVTNIFSQDHIPISHTIPHGTSRICWGYTMGRAGGKYDGNSTCDPVTLVTSENAFETAYFQRYEWSQVDLLQGGDILYWSGTHAMYVASAPKDAQNHVVVDNITVDHTAAAWTEVYHNDPLPTAKQRLSLVGNPTCFYKKKDIQVSGVNLFYGVSNNIVQNQGSIRVNTAEGTSPQSQSLDWTGTSYTAGATSLQEYPTGYRQVFEKWTRDGQVKGTSLQVTIVFDQSEGGYLANFYKALPVTLTPAGGGGGINSGSGTKYTSDTIYPKVYPTPAVQVSATAVNTNSNRTDYLFANWTNSGNGDVDNTASISFYPSAAVTYTANFTAKPLQAENCYAGGVVGNPVQITWTRHPNASVTYQIYRRVKPLGGSTGSETLITSLTNATTSYTDYDYTVTSTYSDDLLSYDVRSYLSGVYSDPNFVQVFAISNRQVEDVSFSSTLRELPTSYSISNFPNPFNPSTTISYQLVEEANVTLQIYDVMGRKISSLVQEQKQAGYYTAKWEGRDNNGKQVATGAYLYRFTAAPTSGKQPFIKSGKLLLTK